MIQHATLIRRARLFQYYARYLWHFHRRLVKKHLHKRCRQCVISEAYAPLNADGLCAACRAVGPESHRAPAGNPADIGAAELDALLRRHQGQAAGPYDALVMLSGGKDSAFLLHELHSRSPGLRLLALTIDNSFMSPVALENARRSAGKLDVDHVILRPAPALYRKSFRLACTLQEAGKGCFETVDRIDADLGFSIAKIHAAANRIPLVVSGLSWAQVERLFKVQSFEVPQDQALAKVHATLGKSLAEIYEPAELKYWWDPGMFPKEAWPRFLHPFYVWRHAEQEIQDQVVRRGLIEEGNDSPLLTNNVIIPLMIVVDYLRLGYASFEPEFAQLVREGKADRRTWQYVFEMLEYAARTGWLLDGEIDKIARRLDVSRADIGLIRKGAA
jgi:hypothetical protein